MSLSLLSHFLVHTQEVAMLPIMAVAVQHITFQHLEIHYLRFSILLLIIVITAAQAEHNLFLVVSQLQLMAAQQFLLMRVLLLLQVTEHTQRFMVGLIPEMV